MVGKVNIENTDVVIDGDLVTINDIPFATTAEMDIYVRAADGNDSNPGTSSLPLATLQAAIDKIPQNVLHTVKIHVGPHSESGYSLPNIYYRNLKKNVYIIGDGGGGGTDGFTEIVSSSAAQSGSDETVVVTTGGMSISEYSGNGVHFGRTIEILSGPAIGDRRTIRNNTATDITPVVDFSASISSGNLYRILEPETILYGTGNSDIFIIGVNDEATDSNVDTHKVVIVNFKVDSPSNYTYWCNKNSSVLLLGVQVENALSIDGYNIYTFSGAEPSATGGTWDVYSPVVDLGVTLDTNWKGWGLAYRNSNPLYNVISITGKNSKFIGGIVAASLWLDGWTYASINYGNFYHSYSESVITCRYNSELWIIGDSDRRILLGTLADATTVIDIGGSSRATIIAQGLNSIILKGSGDIVEVYGQSRAEILVFSSNDMDVESSNGIGFKVNAMGLIDFSYAIPTCSCYVGDFSCTDGETTHDISELVSPSEFSDITNGVIKRV